MEKNTLQNSNPSLQEESSYIQMSFCGIMKESTSELIQKLESEMPSLFQEYSDLYARCLHSIRDIFGACSLAERQYFENLKVDKNILRVFSDNSIFVSKILESHFDMSSSLLRSYVHFRLSFMDSWDEIFHSWVNMYAKTFSQYIFPLSPKRFV